MNRSGIPLLERLFQLWRKERPGLTEFRGRGTDGQTGRVVEVVAREANIWLWIKYVKFEGKQNTLVFFQLPVIKSFLYICDAYVPAVISLETVKIRFRSWNDRTCKCTTQSFKIPRILNTRQKCQLLDAQTSTAMRDRFMTKTTEEGAGRQVHVYSHSFLWGARVLCTFSACWHVRRDRAAGHTP